VLVVAALSFLMPSAPTYDPWAWTIWGREILHLDLTTTTGPSWKPLPMVVTPLFALAGGLAPDLWLFVARAAALASVVVVFKLVRRLGGGAAGATAAAVGYALAAWTIRNGLLGNSEGLLVACALGAVERHLAGHRRQAFVLAVAAGLLRPEAWPFLGLYGLWLAWRMPSARVLVAAGFASLPLLWLLPELWGSGDLLRAMHRAQEPVPGTPGAASHPVTAVLERFQTMLTTSIWVGVIALLGLLTLLALDRFTAGPSVRERRAALFVVAAGAVLVAEVAFLSAGPGFTGSTRYLILPAAVVIVAAGTGVGWLVRALLAGRRPPRVVAAALVGLAAAAFAAPSVAQLGPTVAQARDQGEMTDDLAAAVQHAGGRARLLACGAPVAGPFEVPSVAWQLHMHTRQVSLHRRPPKVIFVARGRQYQPSPPAAGARTLALTRHWRIVGICRSRGGAR